MTRDRIPKTTEVTIWELGQTVRYGLNIPVSNRKETLWLRISNGCSERDRTIHGNGWGLVPPLQLWTVETYRSRRFSHGEDTSPLPSYDTRGPDTTLYKGPCSRKEFEGWGGVKGSSSWFFLPPYFLRRGSIFPRDFRRKIPKE